MSNSLLRRQRILALDDESDILSIFVNVLTKEGYITDTAGTIAEFLERDAENPPDLYIVDLALPDGNGLSVVRDIRRRTDRPIIVISARGDEADHVIGLELGADDYITKPFRIREMTARVNAVLRRSAASPASEEDLLGMATTASAAGNDSSSSLASIDFTFAGYQLSLGARLLWDPDGSEVSLTTAEFNVLVALLQHRGNVLSRDQIMNAAKGREWEIYDRAVDGLVSRLRQKLPAPEGESHYIRTIHGVGYAFRA